jgi:regulatory protein
MKFKPTSRLYTKEAALTKMKAYCAREERCHQDIEQKLIGYRVSVEDREDVIASLISEGFLNESRYATAFVSGKLRQNNWGRRKISLALRQKGISSYCIQEGLNAIEPEDYQQILLRVLEQRRQTIREDNPKTIFFMLLQHGISRGFESELIRSCLQDMEILEE